MTLAVSVSTQEGLWGGPQKGLADVADQGPLSQEQQAEVVSARECLEEAHSPFGEIHPFFSCFILPFHR